MAKHKSICNQNDQEQIQVSKSNQNTNSQSNMNEQSKKIKKQGSKRGRPSRVSEIHQYDQYLIPQLQDKWFGEKISSDLIIYLSYMGSLTIKAKTGPKPQMAAEITVQQKSKIKQFRQKYRKELQRKIQLMLQFLNYRSDRTFFLLKDNKDSKDQLTLNDNQFEQYNSLNNVLKLLDQLFIPSFKLIVQILIQNRGQNEFNMILDIINLLKKNNENQEKTEQYKMLFDLQLIQISIEKDVLILNDMENQLLAEEYRSLQTRVPLIDFSKENQINVMEAIYNESSWLQNFISGIMNIIYKSCS